MVLYGVVRPTPKGKAHTSHLAGNLNLHLHLPRRRRDCFMRLASLVSWRSIQNSSRSPRTPFAPYLPTESSRQSNSRQQFFNLATVAQTQQDAECGFRGELENRCVIDSILSVRQTINRPCLWAWFRELIPALGPPEPRGD
jgi:hypothetical protein